jgi:hypothetical protein
MQLVRIQEKSHHRHLVVRLVRDIRHHDNARLRNIWIYARRQGIHRHRRPLRADTPRAQQQHEQHNGADGERRTDGLSLIHGDQPRSRDSFA